MMTESQRLLSDMANSLFGEYCSNQVILKAAEGEWPAALWQALEDSGLPQMMMSEEAGGSGASLSDACTVIRAAGHHAVPVPLAETILATWLLSVAGLPVTAGPLTIAPVVGDGRISLSRASDGWTISGRLHRVPWARNARQAVIIAHTNQGPMIAAVPVDNGALTPAENLAGEPRDGLDLDQVKLSADQVSQAPDGIDAEALRLLGALTRVALMAGGLDKALNLSVEYVTNRNQFGRPLAKFQVIQQYMARMAAEVAAAGAAMHAAVAAVENALRSGQSLTHATFEVAGAKIRAGEAAGKVAAIAHQVHGAIGFTYDHQLHLTTRRLWSWRDEFGSEAYWAGQLGSMVLVAGPDALWPRLSS